MPVLDQGIGVGVVGDETGEAVVDMVVQHRLDDDGHVVPGAAVAHEGVHATAHLLQHVLRPGGLVAAADAGGDIGVETHARVGHGVVAGDDLIRLQGLRQLPVDVGFRPEHVGEAHHLPKTHDAVPGHHLPDLLGADVGARVLEARHGGHAGGNIGHGLEGRPLCVVDHGLHALGAADVADLVGVHEDAGGPVGHHRPGVFAHADHGGFHMDMGVHEARRDVLAGSVDDLGVLADAMGGVAHEGDPALGNGYVDPFLDLGGADVHQLGIADDQLRLHHAHSHSGHGLGHFV